MADGPIQWHPGFVAAMNLELSKSRDVLRFEKEYNLNVKPLEIDLLIIKKNAHVSLDNEIGSIFKGHNIIEYKNPAEQLDIDVFYKVEAYAILWKNSGCHKGRGCDDNSCAGDEAPGIIQIFSGAWLSDMDSVSRNLLCGGKCGLSNTDYCH